MFGLFFSWSDTPWFRPLGLSLAGLEFAIYNMYYTGLKKDFQSLWVVELFELMKAECRFYPQAGNGNYISFMHSNGLAEMHLKGFILVQLYLQMGD